jgi:hypothetical protein
MDERLLMALHPQTSVPIPEDTARFAHTALAPTNYMSADNVSNAT